MEAFPRTTMAMLLATFLSGCIPLSIRCRAEMKQRFPNFASVATEDRVPRQ